MECNTPFPEYVLSCVFVFSDRIFDLLPVFVLYYELFIWSYCLGFGFVNSESALVWTGDSILVDFSIWSFCYSKLTDFSFKYCFPIFWIFYDFLEFSWIKLKIFKTGVDQYRWPIPGFLIYKLIGITKSVFRHYFSKSHFLSKYLFLRILRIYGNSTGVGIGQYRWLIPGLSGLNFWIPLSLYFLKSYFIL